MSPVDRRKYLMELFEDEWNVKRHTQSKLAFYNTVKTNFGLESYLEINSETSRKSLSRLRGSAHDLKIETGRYNNGAKKPSIEDRACRFCCEYKNYELLKELPEFEVIVESETHVLSVCPKYHHLRMALSDELKCHLMLHQFNFIMAHHHLSKELGHFFHKIYTLRNPKRDKKTKSVARK